MPTLEFLANALGPAVIVEGDGRLMDICDAARAPVEFSCRSANCGTCRVEVQLGATSFEPPSDEERDVLDLFDAPPNHRLACCAGVRPGTGLVRLRWVADD